ncbi:Coiled-coil domain containing protein 106 [Dissostichus eleginoides]|uniref:Coiled-coil domain containing protein 106 n=1 Tax=Dissostichus eleginoides TaxID=100907 RepID=A0AAD9FNZ0_DISEL|nr:Coiled-coil domain containing protein 106 [Dissostichus eleginoides]
MDTLGEKESPSTGTSAASTASTRPKRYPKQKLGSLDKRKPNKTDEQDGSASDLAPTATLLLNKEKQEVKLLKERLEWQMKRTEELEKERDFLVHTQTPNQILGRYKSILKTLKKTKTMTKAFHKHGIDRNTVVSTSSIGELAIAAHNNYQELLSERPIGETVLAFAKRCEAAIQGDVQVKETIESMKADGALLPIRKGKPV